jgi:hypothetical protein
MKIKFKYFSFLVRVDSPTRVAETTDNRFAVFLIQIGSIFIPSWLSFWL